VYAADMCEYIFVSNDSEDTAQIVQEYANHFLASHGPESRAVSFDRRFPSTSSIKYWNDLFSADDEIRIRKEASLRLDRLVSVLGNEFMGVFATHRTAFHFNMCWAVGLDELLRKERLPTIFVLPGQGELGPVASIKMPRERGVPNFWTSPRNCGTARQASSRSPSVSRRAATSNRQIHVVALEDSGTFVNIDPALAICQELRRQGCDPLILTTSSVVRSAAGEADFPVRVIPRESLSRDEYEAIEQEIDYNVGRMLGIGELDVADRFFLSSIRRRMIAWTRDNLLATAELTKIDQECRVSAIITIGMANPLPILAGEYYQNRGACWLAYFPNLVKPTLDIVSSKHPAFYRQANRYLTYGDYLSDQLTSLGIPRELITTVGSRTYDKSQGRDSEADRDYTRNQILKTWRPGEMLVVIATECLQRPFEEIDPVVRNLLAIGGVHVVIKVHPQDSLEMYEEFARTLAAGGRLEVVGPCDLMALLHSADLLIAVYSNIIINAAVLGTPTLVCDFGNKRAPLDFVAAGLCLGCFDPAGLPQMLKDMLQPSETRRRAEDLLRRGISQFNGPNDGQSARRVAHEVEAAGDVYLSENVFVPTDSDEAQDRIGQFLKRCGPRARAVSFCHPGRRWPLATDRVTYWGDLLSSSDRAAIHGDVVARLERLANGLTYEFLQVFRSHRSDLYHRLCHTILVPELVRRERGPICSILPGEDMLDPTIRISAQGNGEAWGDGVQSDPCEDRRPPEKTAWGVARLLEAFGTRGGTFLVAVGDCGNQVLEPALAICQELKREGCMPLVVTTSAIVHAAMAGVHVPARLLSPRPLPPEEAKSVQEQVDYNMRRMLGIDKLDAVDKKFLAEITPSLVAWAGGDLLIINKLKTLEWERQILSVLTVGSLKPIATLAGEQFQERGLKWLAYLPMTAQPFVDVVDPQHRALCRLANQYLTSSNDLADQIASLGVRRDVVATVGLATGDLTRHVRSATVAKKRSLRPLMLAQTYARALRPPPVTCNYLKY
jgi:hypothetical protein